MTNIVEAFGATSTTDEVLSGVSLKDKRILVTGVSAGIGVETARSLAAHGAQVVGAVRDLNKAKAATKQVREAAANGGSFELIELDLASLKSIRSCADGLLPKAEPFDVVIANAGVMVHTARPHSRRFRNTVWDQSPGPLCSSQPDCATHPDGRAPDQRVFCRSPLFQCRPGRS
jgi:NAD(P)-dependent dehydrogenase (short-subunit alcohol dehydrogenase family)